MNKSRKKFKRKLRNKRKLKERWEKTTKQTETKNMLADNTCDDCYYGYTHSNSWAGTRTYHNKSDCCRCIVRIKLLETNEFPMIRTCRWWEWVYQYDKKHN